MHILLDVLILLGLELLFIQNLQNILQLLLVNHKLTNFLLNNSLILSMILLHFLLSLLLRVLGFVLVSFADNKNESLYLRLQKVSVVDNVLLLCLFWLLNQLLNFLHSPRLVQLLMVIYYKLKSSKRNKQRLIILTSILYIKLIIILIYFILTYFYWYIVLNSQLYHEIFINFAFISTVNQFYKNTPY